MIYLNNVSEWILKLNTNAVLKQNLLKKQVLLLIKQNYSILSFSVSL